MRTAMLAVACLAAIAAGGCRERAGPPPVHNAPATAATTQPGETGAWKLAGVWFDLAGRPWTVTVCESAGRQGLGLVMGAPQPVTPPAGLPFAPSSAEQAEPPRVGFSAPGYGRFAIFRPADPPGTHQFAQFGQSCSLDSSHRGLLIATITFGYMDYHDFRATNCVPPPTYVERTVRVELLRDPSILQPRPAAHPRPVAELAAALSQPDWTGRRDAIGELASVAPADAIALLTRALGDAIDVNKVLAVRSLGLLKDPAIIPVLVDVLDSGPAVVQDEVVASLAALGPDTAGELVERLLARLRRDDYGPVGLGPGPARFIPSYASRVFARWSEQSLPSLRAALEGDDAVKRLMVLRWIMPWMTDRPFVRLTAEVVLRRTPGSTYDHTRQEALHALMLAPADSVPVRMLCGQIESGEVWQVLRAKCHGQKAGSQIIQQLRAGMNDVLAQSPPWRLEWTRNVNYTSPPAIQRMAALLRLLGELNHADRAVLRELYLSTRDEELRAYIGDSLGMAADLPQDTLLADSRSANAHLRATAAMRLGQIKSPESTARLIEMLDDASLDVTTAAVWQLCPRDDPTIAPAIVRRLARLADLPDSAGPAEAMITGLGQRLGLASVPVAAEFMLSRPALALDRRVVSSFDVIMQREGGPRLATIRPAPDFRTWWTRSGLPWYQKRTGASTQPGGGD